MIVIGVSARASLYFSGSGLVAQATFTLCALDSLAIGGVLAYIEIYHKDLLSKIIYQYWAIWLATLLLFLFCYLFFAYGLHKLHPAMSAYNLILGRFLISLLTFYLIAKSIIGRSKNLRTIFEQKYVMFLGKISYGMYFYHLFVQRFIDYYLTQVHHTTIKGPYVMFVVYFAATILVSVLSWYVVESPMNGLKKNFKY
jgi:peptidoglycan/LPS O-acetylase OafA/YrhL